MMGVKDIIIILIVYLIGYFITLLGLIKYGKRLGFGDYDEPKTYVNQEDYNSNNEAWTSFSVVWPAFIIVTLIIFGINGLIKLTSKLNKNGKI